MDSDSDSINSENEMRKISIDNKKMEELFKYSNSLGRVFEKTADKLLVKLKKRKQLKNSKTFTNKQMSQSSTSINLFEIISPRNEKWQIVQEALTNTLLGKLITNFTEVLVCVRSFNEQFINNVLVKFYEDNILKNTLGKLQRKIGNVTDLENSWNQFFRKSLPNVILILSSLKTHQEYIERVTLLEFKRRITKIENLKREIMIKKNDNSVDWSIMIHMFLVLQSTTLKDNTITEIDVQFEEVASLLISPLIGYSGIFIDGKLVHRSQNLVIFKKKCYSNSNRTVGKTRQSLSELFQESKSLLDISGKF